MKCLQREKLILNFEYTKSENIKHFDFQVGYKIYSHLKKSFFEVFTFLEKHFISCFILLL